MSLLGFAHRRHLPPKSIHEPALQSPVLVAVAASCPLASLPELLYLNLTDLRFAASYLYVLRVLQSSLIPASTASLPHVLLSGHQMDQGVGLLAPSAVRETSCRLLLRARWLLWNLSLYVTDLRLLSMSPVLAESPILALPVPQAHRGSPELR